MKSNVFILAVLLMVIFQDVVSQNTVVLQPGPEGKDAQLWSVNPDNNYRAAPKFACMAWTHSGVPGVNRAIIDFDLSAIPSGMTIVDAKLSLFFINLEPTFFGHTGDNGSWLQLITEPWEENTATWNFQPATTTDDQVYLPPSTYPYQDYTDIDVTALIGHLYTEPESYHGMMLRLIEESYYRCLLFASSDYMDTIEMRPKLEVTYIDCTPPTVSFEYTTTGLSAAFTGICPSATNWHWDFGDGYLSTLQNPLHEYIEQGQYEVCLTVEDSCGEAEHCEWIDVCDELVSGYTYNAQDFTVFFKDTSKFSNGYFWDFGDGYYSDLKDPWHTFDTSGYYYVCLRTWNDCAEDTICKVIFVEFSDVEEINVPKISIFPNPARDQLFIRAEFNYPISISILTLQGIPLFEGSFILSNGVSAIDISRIPAGIHIVQMKSREFIWNTKLIIQ